MNGLPLVSFCRPSSWLDWLDHLATQRGISLNVVVAADFLSLQPRIVEDGGMYALLGPYAIANAVREGRLQAADVVDPTFYRYIALAMSRHGDLTHASRTVMQLTKRPVQKGCSVHLKVFQQTRAQPKLACLAQPVE
ncbi:LysR substrate-binding domain-containing protein [Ralstonia mojiangensis]|uniref:LysR substrate-binding domain-containing protein n=1 Tax=Ralstonia mojiangensis TaxID=2953895 RepID=UPI002091382E|nr:LysR substrate-binding domain-containing protein [Ralstonia mojiangensis]MCO5413439.1 LysR substrate-binding domain-containing protein [Ralstonia mojiangensis]